MKPEEKESHLSAIEGLQEVIKLPDAKKLLGIIALMLIKKALKWLEAVINKLEDKESPD